MYFTLSYLELAPQYECFSGAEWLSCQPADFCGKDVAYRVSYSCKTCLHNWVEKLSLTCVPKWKVGLLGSSLWMGWVLSLLFLPRIADIYGRRWIYLLGMWLLMPILFAMLFTRSLNAMIAIIFMQGFLSTVRVSIGYVYMLEFIPKPNQTIVGTWFSMQVPIITLLATLYFSEISKHWFWLVMVGVILLVCCCVLAIMMPESPKYLLK